MRCCMPGRRDDCRPPQDQHASTLDDQPVLELHRRVALEPRQQLTAVGKILPGLRLDERAQVIDVVPNKPSHAVLVGFEAGDPRQLAHPLQELPNIVTGNGVRSVRPEQESKLVSGHPVSGDRQIRQGLTANRCLKRSRRPVVKHDASAAKRLKADRHNTTRVGAPRSRHGVATPTRHNVPPTDQPDRRSRHDNHLQHEDRQRRRRPDLV